MADSKIQIEVEVIGAEKATKQLQQVETQSINIKEGVNGVGESFKSVGDLVTSQGGVMGEAFGTLGDSVIAVTDSILVFKDGMATAGATGAKAWLGLLGPIAMVVSAVALAVDAYRQLSGSMLEAEENAENMAAAASDTASRLEAMVENGIVLSTNALKEFIQVNERARLKIEQTIKANEKRATSELKVKEAREALNKAENSWFLSSARQLKAQYDLSKAEEEYNKLLENQIKLQNDASKAQDESFKLEQLVANDLDFFVSELTGVVDTYADLEGQLVKTTNAQNADASATLVSATTKKKYYEEIKKAKDIQNVYDQQLEKGIISQKAYDEVTKANKKNLQDLTEVLKKNNTELGVKVGLEQANADITKTTTELTKTNNVVVSSGISLAERRLANYENINRIQKEYLANLSKEQQAEKLLKEVVVGREVIEKRKYDQIANLIDEKEREYEELKTINENEIQDLQKFAVKEKEIYTKRVKNNQILYQAFAGTSDEAFKKIYENIKKDMDVSGKRYIEAIKRYEDNISNLQNELDGKKLEKQEAYTLNYLDIYKEEYMHLEEIALRAYEIELKDLDVQQSKLKKKDKNYADEMENIKKARLLAEQNFKIEKSKIEIQFEKDINDTIIKIQTDRLNKSLEMNKKTLDKELIDLDLANSKKVLSNKKVFDAQIQDYKKSRSPFLSLFIDENKYLNELTDKFNKDSEFNTLETEKSKLEIETRSQEERLKKLKEFTDETGKISIFLKDQATILNLAPSVKIAKNDFNNALNQSQEFINAFSSMFEDVDLAFENFIEGFIPAAGGGAMENAVKQFFELPKEQLVKAFKKLNEAQKEMADVVETQITEIGGDGVSKGLLEKLFPKSEEQKTFDFLSMYKTKWEDVSSTLEKASAKLKEFTGVDVESGFFRNFGATSMADVSTEISNLREKYKIDPSKDIEGQVNKLREGYQTEVEALQISLEQKKLLIDDYNMKINKSNEEKANKDIETSKMEYSTVRGMLYDMTDAYAQSASANIATAFYQGESIKEALKNTLQSLAIESTSKAIYETAAGFASLAIPGMQTSSALHFKAAAMYGSVALLAGVGTKLAPPSGGGATAPTTPTGNTQGISQTRSAEDKGQVQNFYINFGGAVIYDTKKSAEMAMAERVIQLGMSSRRGFNPPIDNRNGR